MLRSLAVLLLAAGAWSAPAMAEAPFAVGQRLRVDFSARSPGSRPGVTRLTPSRQSGALVAMDSASLELRTRAHGPALHIAFADIEGLAVSEGRSPRQGLLHGALYGAAIGLAIGAAVNAATFDRLDPDAGEFGILGVVAIGAAGAVIGGGVGSNLGRESWREVPVRRLWGAGP